MLMVKTCPGGNWLRWLVIAKGAPGVDRWEYFNSQRMHPQLDKSSDEPPAMGSSINAAGVSEDPCTCCLRLPP